MTISDSQLSEREQEILRLLATGVSNKEIATQLFISPNTVKVHLRNIFTKIGVSSRTEAVMYAVNQGLVSGIGKVVSEEKEEDHQAQEAPEEAAQASISLPLPQDGKRKPILSPLWAPLIMAVVIIAVLVGMIVQNLNPFTPAATDLASPTPDSHWKDLAALPVARYSLALVAYENKLFALGGRDSEGVTGRVDIYDPEQDTWQSGASKPTPVQDIAAVVGGGKIFVPGGLTASGELTDTLEIYNPNTDMWSNGQPLPLKLSAYGLAVFEGQIFLFGGWDGATYRTEVYRYDMGLNAWRLTSQMPEARAYFGVVVTGRKMILIGGKNQRGAMAEMDIFLPDLLDDLNGPWKPGAPSPAPVYGMGLASVADVVYCVGGEGKAGVEAPALAYFTQTNEWQTLQFNTAGFGRYLAISGLGPYLYVMGGEVSGQPVGRNMRYQALYTITLPIITK